MTARELGATGLKLMGTFFAVSAVIRLLGLVATLFTLPREAGLPGTAALFRVNALGFFIELAVAGALVLRADSLADRMFSSQRLEISAVSRRDLLVGGIALLGVSAVVAAAPGIIQFAGKAIWFAQGSRQAYFLPSMEQSWAALAKDVIELAIGGVLLTKAMRFGSALDGRYRRDEQT